MFEALKTLRGKVVGATGALVLCGLLVLTATNIWTARHHALQSLTAQTRALSHAHAAGVTDWVTARHQVVKSIADKVKEDQPMPFLTQAKLAGDVDSIYIGYPDKRTVFSEVQNLPPDYDPTARPWYKQAAQAGTSVVTPPCISASDQKLVVTFATPVGAGSALKGVAAGDVYMESVVANVASIQPTPQSFAFLVSADGKIIAHKDQGLTLKPITELSKDLAIEPLLAAAKNKGLLPTDIAGRSRLLSVVPIAGTSWMLVVALDESEAMAPIRAMLATSLISSVLVLVVAAALLGVVLRPPASRSTAVRWSAMW